MPASPCDPTKFSALVLDQGTGKYKIDHAKLRGANWFGLGPNPLVFWKNFNLAQVELELDYAKSANINSLRIFLSYEAYTLDPFNYKKRLNLLLAACCKRGIVLLVTVTDFCFGWNGRGAVERWAGTPGVFFMERLELAPFLAYLDEVFLTTRIFPPWLTMFDLANEPTSNPWSWKDPLGSGVPALLNPINILVFLMQVSSKLFAKAAEHEITIGEGLIAQFGSADFLAQFPFTFQSIHGGYTDAAVIANLMATIPPTSLRPVVLTETAADPAVIPGAVDAANAFQCGFMFWGLMKGFNQWNSFSGLFRPDGSVTDLAAYEALRDGVPGNPPPSGPEPFPRFIEKLQIRLALARLNAITTVTAENADEMRSLPWELLFWGFFAKEVAVHEELLGIHQVIAAAYQAEDIPAAYVAIKQFVAVAHAAVQLVDMSVTAGEPRSKHGR